MRPPVQVILAAAFLAVICVVPAGAAQARTHTVDYVIGMLEAGVDQPTILARIHDAHLTFQVAAGDLDRLRDAGAGDALVQAVKGAAVPPEGTGVPPAASSRPQRLGQGAGEPGERLEATTPEREGAPDEEMEPPDGSEAQQPEEAPHGGYPYYSPGEDWGYDGYYPPYYVYYGPPYYYYPYYPFYYSFYYPYPFFHNRAFIGGRSGHGGSSVGRTVPRGTPRGGSRPPSGGMSRPRPRGH